MKTYHIHTFWCTMNFSDSERICSILDDFWLYEVSNSEDADVVIFNTCSIKQKAEDKVFWYFNQLKKIKKKFPNKKYGITGCMIKETWIKDKNSKFFSKDELLYKNDLVDFVFRIMDLPKLPKILKLWEEKKEFFEIKQKLKSPFQAIVPIQTWCDNFCTFCVVPNTRWRENSRKAEDICKEISFYAKKWVKEVILVGQNVNSYGKWMPWIKRKFDEENKQWLQWEEKTPFALLLLEVSKIKWIERIRFQSSNPHDMTDDILKEILENEKVMPALHFALQSGNNEVLKRMKRRHTFEKFEEICKKLRKENEYFWISTDLIVWFCGESEKEYQDTLIAMEKINFDMIYISQYSLRKWTFAWDKMKDDISKEEKSKRWHKANEFLKENIAKRMKLFEWKIVKVLVEKKIWEFFEWKCEENYVCRFSGKDLEIWDICGVKILGKSEWSLQGEMI